MARLDLFRVVKPLIACFVVMAVFACGGGGCSGCASCGLEPIPGGFPVSQPRIPNSGQIRLSQTGIEFLEDNAGSLAALALGGSLSFEVPTTRIDNPVALVDAIVVCPRGGCRVQGEIQDLDITPVGPNRLHVVLQLILDSRNAAGTRAPLPVFADLAVGSANLDVDLDTRRGARAFVAVQTDITFTNEPRSPRTGFTRIDVGAINLVDGQGIENDDIRITGSGLSALLAFLINLFKGTIVDLLTDQIASLSDGLVGDNLCTTAGTSGCPTGTFTDGSGPDAICRFARDGDCVPTLLGLDGQGDLGNAFLGGISPGTRAPIQFVLASGEDGVAINNGMSLYMTGGFLSYDPSFTTTPGHNPCVPLRERPPVPAIARVPAFQGNVIPGTSTPVHLGIGVAEDYLNYVGYGMYDSGMLCLGVGTRLSQQLSTGLFSVLVPTLRALTYPNGASPISIAVRPQQPPTFEIGAGTTEDPVLTITLPEAQIDFYVWSQERYIRFMTYQTDLVIGVNLVVMGGQIVPEIVGITPTRSSVTNSEILTENPASLASTIETVLTMFAGMLTSGISGFDLPPIDLDSDGRPDITIDIPAGGIRGVTDGGEEFLGIFANLALSGSGGSALVSEVDTTLSLSDLEILPESMGMNDFDQNGRNTVWLHFDALGPAGVDYEYSYRIDGALWSPWTRDRRVQIDDAALLLQAHHTIEARARIAGNPSSVDRTPASAQLLIDILPPELTLEQMTDREGVRVVAQDIVTSDERLEMRWRLAEGAWSSWGPVTDLEVDPELVEVEVRDEAGNVGRSSAPLIRGIPNPAGGGGCGCRVGNARHEALGLLASVALLGLLVARRSRKQSRKDGSARPFDGAGLLLALAAVLASGAMAGCDCGGAPGTPDAGFGTDAPPVACGTMTCRPANPPADLTGDICCESSSMCVAYDLNELCDPGFTCPLANVTIDGSCSVRCSACEALPPLPTGILATDLDLVTDGATSYLSGYNPGVVGADAYRYGDLVFGTLAGGDASTIRWEIVDGLPARPGRPTGAVDGWRGGIQEAGDDVGRYTSMTRAASGTFYIAYYDVTNRALKIAIGTPGAWRTHTVDASGDSGRYASIALTASGAPAIAYMRVEPAADGSGRLRSAVRVATAASATPAATTDWTSTEVSGLDVACRPQFCGTGEVCLGTGSCVTPATGCAPACSGDSACVAGSCQATLPSNYVEDLFPGRGLYAELAAAGSGLALTFYDRTQGNLWGAAFDGTTWGTPFLIDGYSRTGAGDSGIGSSLFVDPSGTWHVAYVDGTDEGLRYAQVTGGAVTVRELVDDGTTDGSTPHPDGRHIVGDDASIVVTAGGEVRIAYQDATSHRLMLARRSGTTWATRILDDEDHTGFWVSQAPTATGSRVATWWRRQTGRSTIDGVRVFSGD